MSELLVVVIVADAAQNGMAGGYTSVTTGVVLVATILFWDRVLEFLSFRFRPLQRLVTPSPLLLVRHGRVIPEAMRKEQVTDEELGMLLRMKGVENVEEVEEAYLEGLGGFSVRLREDRHGDGDDWEDGAPGAG